MALNPAEIDSALDLISLKSERRIHFWDQRVDPAFKLESIEITNLGAYQLPFHIEQVASIFNDYKEPYIAGQAGNEKSSCCTVKADHIIIAPCNSSSLKESFSQSLNQTIKDKFVSNIKYLRLNFDVCMKSLVLCQESETFLEIQTKNVQPGTFGIILLQLPVEQESLVSSKVKVQHDGKVMTHSYQGKPPYHLTFVAGSRETIQSTKVEVQAIGMKPAVFLVYHLVWLHSYNLVKDSGPSVLNCCRKRECRVLTNLKPRHNDRYISEGPERHALLQEVNLLLALKIHEEGEFSNECQRSAFLHELLYLCTRLKAVHEGLEVLEFIYQRQGMCNCRKADAGDDLISVTLEIAIVRLIYLAGWEKCSNLVYGIYSSYESEDYVTLYELSGHLERMGCMKQAIYFAKGCLRILEEEGCENVDGFDWDDVKKYLDSTLTETYNMDQERKEIYALFEIIALNDPSALEFMISFYIENVETAEEKLADLKLIITNFIHQIDDYHEHGEVFIFFVICFTSCTRNDRLTRQVWQKLFLPEEDGSDSPLFEWMLSDQENWNLFNCAEHLYEAISLSPLATQRFYEFIDNRLKTRSDDPVIYNSDLEACLFHLTISEITPDLADEQKLHSYLSIFKEMDLNSLVAAAKGIDHLDLSTHDNYSISSTITSALLESLPTNDLASLLSQETAEFSQVVNCFIKVGFADSMREILNETFLNGNPVELDDTETEETDDERLLLGTWLTCLKQKLDDAQSNQKAVAIQVLYFFKVYFEVEKVDLPNEVTDVGELIFISDEITCKFLEKTLVILYERERAGVAKCLKSEEDCWKISQNLSNLLATHPQMETALLASEPEHIVKLMCCIFWLESEDATKNFVNFVCSLPFTKSRYCLSLFILSPDALRNCAVSSAYAFSALQTIVRHCIKQLFTDVCENQWARHDVATVNHPQVVAFYKSEKKSTMFGHFKTLFEANSFAKSATKYLPWADYDITKSGKSYVCKIVKLYPVHVDAAVNRDVLITCQILRESCDKFLPENRSSFSISSVTSCSICSTLSLMCHGDSN